MSEQKPIALFAFANDFVSSRYLRNVPEEYQQIKDVMEPVDSTLCECVFLPNATLNQILNEFTRHRNRIAIFHYGGHADSFKLLLETSDRGVLEANAKALAEFMRQQSGLELVFLNGCSTRQQVCDFLDAGISSVIATSQAIDDEAALIFAAGFYGGLATGATIRGAFEEAASAAKLEKGDRTRDLYADGVADDDAVILEERLPWEIHFKPGAENIAKWNLPEAANDPLFGIPKLSAGYLPDKPFLHLGWFTRADAEIFFGREHEVRELYDRVVELNASPVILFYGQSGVGKSSLLEAGLLPRLESGHETQYVRRKQEIGLLETVKQALSPADPNLTLEDAWRTRESEAGRPLVIILDQVEEVFTRPNKDLPDELPAFLANFEALCNRSKQMRGKLILGFRKEWASEIEGNLNDRKLDYSRVFLEHLSYQGIINAITGLTRTERLQKKYGLEIIDDLPLLIAVDLSEDRESPIAPTLQVLLTKMWDRAKELSNTNPVFDEDLYQGLKDEGILLGDFLDQQLLKLREGDPEIVDSGLALDVLAYHTTPLGTAEQHTAAEVESEYSHRKDKLADLIPKLKTLYLLSDPPQDQQDATLATSTRLAHDTIAPPIRARFNKSVLPGQRARRVLENRGVDWAGGREGTTLDKRDLASIEAGINGMRALTGDENRLLKATRRSFARKRLTVLVAVAILALLAGLTWLTIERNRKADEDRARISELVMDGMRQQSLSRGLVTAANALGNSDRRFVERQVLLAIEAHRRFATAESDSALREALKLLPKRVNRRKFDGSTHVLAFSPDNKVLADSDGKAVRLWNFVTNEETGYFKSDSRIDSLVFSPDGKYLMAVNGQKLDSNDALFWGSLVFEKDESTIEGSPQNGRIVIWDCQQQKQLPPIEFPTPLTSVNFVKDAGSIVTADGAALKIYSVDGTEEKTVLTFDKAPELSASTPDGKYFAIVEASQIKIYDVLSGSLYSRIDNETPPKFITFVQNGDELFVGGYKDAQVWNWRARRQTANGKIPAAFRRVISPDGKYGIHLDNVKMKIQVWKTSNGENIFTPLEGGYFVRVKFSPDSRYFGIFDRRRIRIFQVSRSERSIFESVGDAVQFLHIGADSPLDNWVYSSDGRFLATSDTSGLVSVWEPRRIDDTGKIEDAAEVLYDRTRKYMAVSGKGHLTLFNADTRAPIASFALEVEKFNFAGNGERLAFSYPAGENISAIKVVDVPTGNVVRQVENVPSSTVFMLSADGLRLILAPEVELIKEMDLAGGSEVPRPEMKSMDITLFSQDARYMATRTESEEETSQEMFWKIFEISTGKELARISSTVRSAGAVFSTGGDHLAVIIDPKNILIWGLKENREIARVSLENISDNTAFSLETNMSFSDDDKYLVATAGPSAFVWEAGAGKLIKRLDYDSGYVANAIFSSDSKYIVTTRSKFLMGFGESAEIWTLPDGQKINQVKIEGGISSAFLSPDQSKLVLAGGWMYDPKNRNTKFVPWKPKDLICEACLWVDRDLYPEEWAQYLEGEPYRKTCGDLP